MRDQLVGYLCGALDEHEQADVERSLVSDPQLREELDRLRGAFTPPEVDAEHFAAPAGLASRTCDSIFTATRPAKSASLQPGTQLRKSNPSSRVGFTQELVRRNWRMLDSAIALGAIAAAALL